jgi:hypothetical protein
MEVLRDLWARCASVSIVEHSIDHNLGRILAPAHLTLPSLIHLNKTTRANLLRRRLTRWKPFPLYVSTLRRSLLGQS